MRLINYAYPEQRLAIEVDDYWSHMNRRRFDLDRARKWELLECGWRVGEVTSTVMKDRPREVVWSIATVLNLEPAGWRRARSVNLQRDVRPRPQHDP